MPAEPFVITVLAGVNGAGKSSVGGAHLERNGGVVYNPDVVALAASRVSSSLTGAEANAYAWQRGRDLLAAAIANRTDFTFETRLGGETILHSWLKQPERQPCSISGTSACRVSTSTFDGWPRG